MTRTHILPNRRHLLAGGAAATATLTAPAIVRALGGPLKVGVLLPLSGFEADDGQGCQRGVAITPPILRSLGLPPSDVRRRSAFGFGGDSFCFGFTCCTPRARTRTAPREGSRLRRATSLSTCG
jgi:hypothetical protein